MKFFTPLKIIFLLEFFVVFFISIGILPREVALFLTGILLFYLVFAPIDDSLIFLFASIPLFIALPITESFDSMASWRILVSAVFFVWVVRSLRGGALATTKQSRIIKGFSVICGIASSPFRFLAMTSRHSGKNWKELLLTSPLARFLILSFLFFSIGLLSLIRATDFTAGIKKILFLGNIFLFFILIVNIIRTRENILRVIKAAAVAGGITVAVGFIQLIAVFKWPLYTFWQFWAANVSGTFYGKALANLLSYSNTWFSYYDAAPPTLRLFSIMPDSHSFAMMAILSAPLFLVLAFHYRSERRKKNLSFFFLILSILAIILSGSRGAWLSIIFPLGILILLLGLYKKPHRLYKEHFLNKCSSILKFSVNYFYNLFYKFKNNTYSAAALYVLQFKHSDRQIIKLTLFSIGLFFLMFIVSSFYPPILYKFQSLQENSTYVSESLGFFERAKSISDITEVSNKGRLEIWRKTISSISEHPLLGVGIGNFPIVLGEDISSVKRGASAHNLYLDIFSEMGIFGLLVFLLLIFEILQTSWRVFKRNSDNLFKLFALAFGVYAIWIFAYSFFDVTLFNDKVLMMFMVEVGILYAMDLIRVCEHN